MKIVILTDLEGVAGIVNFDDWCSPTSKYYEQAKLLLTEEVNAAIRGFYDAAGDQIEEIMVVDGHGPGAINTIALDERATYSRGWGIFHEFGLSRGFDVMAVIGQHAKASTVGSHLTHTGYFDVLECKINGISVGEYGRCAMIAGSFGTKVILCSGERAFCKEATDLIPQVYTAETKYGVCLDSGEHCNTEEYSKHNLGAVHVHPNVSRKRIYDAAKASMQAYVENPDSFKVCCPEPPYVHETWFRTTGTRRPWKEVQRHETDILKMFSAPITTYNEGEFEPYK